MCPFLLEALINGYRKKCTMGGGWVCASVFWAGCVVSGIKVTVTCLQQQHVGCFRNGPFIFTIVTSHAHEIIAIEWCAVSKLKRLHIKAEHLQLCVFEAHFKVAVDDVYRALIVSCQVTADSLSRRHASSPMRILDFQVCTAVFPSVCIIDPFDCSKPCPFFIIYP